MGKGVSSNESMLSERGAVERKRTNCWELIVVHIEYSTMHVRRERGFETCDLFAKQNCTQPEYSIQDGAGPHKKT